MKWEGGCMEVKFEIKKNDGMAIHVADKVFSINYKSNDVNIFEKTNIEILRLINTAEGITRTTLSFDVDEDSAQFKIGKSIADTYLEEINQIMSHLNGGKSLTLENI